MTPAGIEPVTFRFVAQHLNRCATAVEQGNFYSDYQKTLDGVTRGQLVNTCHKQERIWEEPYQQCEVDLTCRCFTFTRKM